MSETIGNDDAERHLFSVPIRRLSARLGLLVQREVLRPFGLKVQEWRVLWSLAQDGDAHLRELARRSFVDPAHVSRLLVKFEREALISRFPDAHDSRRQMIRITAKGLDLYREVRPRSLELNEKFRAIYTDEEYAQFMNFVRRATKCADEMIAAESAEAAERDPSDPEGIPLQSVPPVDE